MNNLIDIKHEIEDINKILKNKYGDLFSMNNKKFGEDIIYSIGKLKSMKKLNQEELKNLGLVVGVDGSTNRVGGAYPHYIDLFQALAKPTKGEDLFINRVYSPILDEDDEELAKGQKENMLAKIEIDVAIKSIEKHKPSILMMDGGLLRYKISAGYEYNNLVKNCEDFGIILLGVIKDLKTDIVSRVIKSKQNIYDREVLYGRIPKGQYIEIYDDNNKKAKEGFTSAFLRSSSSAMITGLDMLNSQREYMDKMVDLVYSLTPDNSRGVPLWLDIVDKEVKITDVLIKSMLEEYLDRDIYERFFISERDRRSL